MANDAQYYQTKCTYVGFVKTIQGKETQFDQYQVYLENGVQGFSYIGNGTPLPFKVGDSGKYMVTTGRDGTFKIKLLRENSGGDWKKKKSGGGGYGKSNKEIALNTATALASNLAAAKIAAGQQVSLLQAAGETIKTAELFLSDFLEKGSAQTPAAPPQAPAPPQNFNPPPNPAAMQQMTSNPPQQPPQPTPPPQNPPQAGNAPAAPPLDAPF